MRPMNWIADIVIAVLALAGTLGGAYFANRRSAALVLYRLEQLEKKVDLHNKVIDRTYALEKRSELLDERDRELERRLAALEAE